jgi:hypothetical protein
MLLSPFSILMNSPPSFASLRIPPLYGVERGKVTDYKIFISPSLRSREGDQGGEFMVTAKQ